MNFFFIRNKETSLKINDNDKFPDGREVHQSKEKKKRQKGKAYKTLKITEPKNQKQCCMNNYIIHINKYALPRPIQYHMPKDLFSSL